MNFLSDDPQSITAWAKGSEAERRLAESLTRRVGDRAVLLYDRKVPKTRGNIDHMAVASSGVWVIDAKQCSGLVEKRDKGGLSKVDFRLYVNGRGRTKLVEGSAGRSRRSASPSRGRRPGHCGALFHRRRVAALPEALSAEGDLGHLGPATRRDERGPGHPRRG